MVQSPRHHLNGHHRPSGTTVLSYFHTTLANKINTNKPWQAYTRAHSRRLRPAGGVLRHRASIQAAVLRRPGFGFLGQVVHVLRGGNGERESLNVYLCVTPTSKLKTAPISAQHPLKPVLLIKLLYR